VEESFERGGGKGKGEVGTDVWVRGGGRKPGGRTPRGVSTPERGGVASKAYPSCRKEGVGLSTSRRFAGRKREPGLQKKKKLSEFWWKKKNAEAQVVGVLVQKRENVEYSSPAIIRKGKVWSIRGLIKKEKSPTQEQINLTHRKRGGARPLAEGGGG